MESLDIMPVSNGFIVAPSHNDMMTVKNSNMKVFESYDGLFDYIKKLWGPVEEFISEDKKA